MKVHMAVKAGAKAVDEGTCASDQSSQTGSSWIRSIQMLESTKITAGSSRLRASCA
ncbi:hypothetical protein M2244_004022 [Rhodoferax antarcticus]|nr:hypothetical protein [Rhodoferax antarcticus]